MSRSNRTDKARASAYRAREAAESATSNPYLRKLIEDAELRENIRGAWGSAKSAVGRLQSSKAPAKAAMDDKKVHKDLRAAADSIRAASESIREQPKKRRWPKLIAIGVIGAGAALALNEGARKAVLDKLFGAEEEFEYTSTTTSNGTGSPSSAEAAAGSTSSSS
jgi:hypothetical protein